MASAASTLIRKLEFGSSLCGCTMSRARSKMKSMPCRNFSVILNRSFSRMSAIAMKNEGDRTEVEGNNDLQMNIEDDNFTHFGYENVAETEKKQKGKISIKHLLVCRNLNWFS